MLDIYRREIDRVMGLMARGASPTSAPTSSCARLGRRRGHGVDEMIKDPPLLTIRPGFPRAAGRPRSRLSGACRPAISSTPCKGAAAWSIASARSLPDKASLLA